MNDRALVSGILQNDERFLRAFYKQYYLYLKKMVGKKIADEQDIEEIVQDTLLSSIESMRDFTFSSKLSTYVVSIAYRKTADFYRKQKMKRIVFSRIPHIDALWALVSSANAKSESDNAYLKERIAAAFVSLSPSYQTILKLKYIEGRSVLEIARMLSLTFKATESKLFRARRAFIGAYNAHPE
jgi:RNA polymerase sigma factor (sigma-70 family)